MTPAPAITIFFGRIDGESFELFIVDILMEVFDVRREAPKKKIRPWIADHEECHERTGDTNRKKINTTRIFDVEQERSDFKQSMFVSTKDAAF
jgi:hypothetical protein